MKKSWSIALYSGCPNLKHKDQLGFMPCRQGGKGDNIRITVVFIEVVNKINDSTLCLSFDTEEAFYHLN